MTYFLSEMIEAWPKLAAFFKWYIPMAVMIVMTIRRFEKKRETNVSDLRL
jgi:hypothetical protein